MPVFLRYEFRAQFTIGLNFVSKPDEESSDHQLDTCSRAWQSGIRLIKAVFVLRDVDQHLDSPAHPCVQHSGLTVQFGVSRMARNIVFYLLTCVPVLLRQGLPVYPRLVMNLRSSWSNFPTAEITTFLFCFVFVFKALVMWQCLEGRNVTFVTFAMLLVMKLSDGSKPP